MKKLLNKDGYAWGAMLCVASEVLCGLLLWIVLWVAGLDVRAYVRWFAVAFVPALLLLRYYAREKEYPASLRAAIVTFFVTFVAFMWFLLKYRYITFD